MQILYRAQTGTTRTRHSQNFTPHTLILSFVMVVLFIKNISLKVYLSKWETYMIMNYWNDVFKLWGIVCLWISTFRNIFITICKRSLQTTEKTNKARFRRRTFHEPNLIPWIKYMKSSASESIRNACFNMERLSRSFRLTRPGISPLQGLWNGFDLDAELFMYRT